MSVPYLGDFAVGSVIYVPFATYAGSTGASTTMTGLAVTDIEIYKNGSTTQRGSDNGYTLLDTDGIDFDGITGLHGFSIDTGDNSTSGFFVEGADYWVVVSTITVDSQTVTFIAAVFSIGNRRSAGEMVKTTIATLASQTSFTLTAGSADNDAYNNCIAIVSDIASGVQKCVGLISDYTGSTKTITLAADPGIFTMAAGDNITILASSSLANVRAVNGTLQTARDIGASVLLSSGTGTGQVSLSSGTVTVGTNNDKTGYGLSSAAVQAVWDALTSALTTANSIGKRIVDYLTGDIYARLGAPAGPSVSADIAAVLAAIAALRVKKNAALANFEFVMFDSADHVSGKTGLTITAERSIDGAAFGACANSASAVGSGVYKIDLDAADLNGNVITLKFTATGADPMYHTLITQP